MGILDSFLLVLFLHVPITIVLIAIIAFVTGTNRYKGGKNYYYKRKSNHSYSNYKQKRALSRGQAGELEVSLIIGDTIPRRRYVFNDSLIKLGDQTSQIDHILVNRAGVFVIETKNYSGRIYGDVNSDDWVQISRKGHRHTFYNPIMQNESHVRIIRKIVGNDVKIFPFVVFVKSTPPFSVRNLIHISQLKNKLIDTSVNINLSSDEIMEVASKINSHISHSSVDRAKHLEDAKHFKAENKMRAKQAQKASAQPLTSQSNQSSNDSLCPRCHKKLVLRKKPYSEFWECSGAPHCSYTKPVK